MKTEIEIYNIAADLMRCASAINTVINTCYSLCESTNGSDTLKATEAELEGIVNILCLAREKADSTLSALEDADYNTDFYDNVLCSISALNIAIERIEDRYMSDEAQLITVSVRFFNDIINIIRLARNGLQDTADNLNKLRAAIA